MPNLARSQKIYKIAATLLKSIIAITGASGAGKSFFARHLLQVLSERFPSQATAIISEDSYYRDQAHVAMADRERVNYDHPDSLEHSLLTEHLSQLKQGKAVDVPVYDYANHTRDRQVKQLAKVDILIVEGILLFTDSALRQQFDFRIFVNTALDVCLQRRMERDCKERGRTEASVQAQFEATVKPMYYQFIDPSREHAHMQIPGDRDPDELAEHVLQEIDHQGWA